MAVEVLQLFSALARGLQILVKPVEMGNTFTQCQWNTSVLRPNSGGVSLFLDYFTTNSNSQGDLRFAGRISTTKKHRRVKFWLRVNDPGSGLFDTVLLWEWGVSKVGLKMTHSAGGIVIDVVGGALFQFAINYNQDYIIEFYWRDDATSPYAEVWVDGVSQGSSTDSGFNRGSTESFLHFGFNVGKNIEERYEAYIQDMWVQAADAESDAIPDPLPFQAVGKTVSDGAYTEFTKTGGGTGIWSEWDDLPSDGDTSYNESLAATTLKRQLAAFESMATIGLVAGDKIEAVRTCCIARVESGSNGQPAVLVRDNGSDYATSVTPTGVYTDGSYDRIDVTMPNGGAEWTQARADAFEGGMQRGSGANPMRNLRAADVYQMVAYTPLNPLLLRRQAGIERIERPLIRPFKPNIHMLVPAPGVPRRRFGYII